MLSANNITQLASITEAVDWRFYGIITVIAHCGLDGLILPEAKPCICFNLSMVKIVWILV